LAKRDGEKRAAILVLSVLFLLPESQVESAQSGPHGRRIRFARLAALIGAGWRLERDTGRLLQRQALWFSGKPAAEMIKQRQLVTGILQILKHQIVRLDGIVDFVQAQRHSRHQIEFRPTRDFERNEKALASINVKATAMNPDEKKTKSREEEGSERTEKQH
jgi:hypothetical protein